ncbi:MAG TPA: adenylosuccinate lyase [Gammaproteobacteria bacterium]|nr:adenylosuccinate lyase [Gammaproteobacteria bacterium]
MELSTLTALSPLDGRYASKAAPLRRYLSEYALIRYRVLIEIRWLQHLADEPSLEEVQPLAAPVKDVLNRVVDDFSPDDARRVKAHEQETNHDVKAVEYFLRQKLEGVSSRQDNLVAFLHFASTSEDINNLAYSLMLRDARSRVLLPAMKALTTELRAQAHRYAALPMLARTHGQAASPTTLGKELANFVYRMTRQTELFSSVAVYGKLNGAVGNFNAHVVAYPDTDWRVIGERFVRSLGLEPTPYTTQIEPHDWIAEYCQALTRFNSVVIDLCRDLWGYVSLGYFRSRAVPTEVGSSTMPHKVNPIDLENAEGNLGVANALLQFFAAKLPLSRWQRDLTDSTVLRNLAVALGHSLIAFESCQRGLGKLEADANLIAADLEESWEVLAEAVQTVMRRYGIADAYEQLKSLTRGRRITKDVLHEFIGSIDLPEAERARLLALRPADYVGLAAAFAAEV